MSISTYQRYSGREHPGRFGEDARVLACSSRSFIEASWRRFDDPESTFAGKASNRSGIPHYYQPCLELSLEGDSLPSWNRYSPPCPTPG